MELCGAIQQARPCNTAALVVIGPSHPISYRAAAITHHLSFMLMLQLAHSKHFIGVEVAAPRHRAKMAESLPAGSRERIKMIPSR